MEAARKAPAGTNEEGMTKEQNRLEMATLAGGCFWCLEAVFEQMRGIERVVSGYTGGALPNPSYEAVCSGKTGHAEAVQLTFDTQQLTFSELLTVFFSIHDPTTPNRQGNDIGTQYRSAIFYHSDAQRAEAEAMIAELDGKRFWPEPIVTQLAPASAFYPAEDYHQHYFARNPGQGYCQFVVAPKLEKFRKYFSHLAR
jgi:peptide-methionine (S)-S-oxide reductase